MVLVVPLIQFFDIGLTVNLGVILLLLVSIFHLCYGIRSPRKTIKVIHSKEVN